jgi:hypothetical protein
MGGDLHELVTALRTNRQAALLQAAGGGPAMAPLRASVEEDA